MLLIGQGRALAGGAADNGSAGAAEPRAGPAPGSLPPALRSAGLWAAGPGAVTVPVRSGGTRGSDGAGAERGGSGQSCGQGSAAPGDALCRCADSAPRPAQRRALFAVIDAVRADRAAQAARTEPRINSVTAAAQGPPECAGEAAASECRYPLPCPSFRRGCR